RMGSMSFPQPSNDPQSQQPGYPPPPAPASGANSIDFNAIMAPENRAYLIAGVGGLVALLGYFILPYYTVSVHVATFSQSGSATGSQIGSWLTLSLLGSIVALVVAAILALGIRGVPQLTPQLGSRVILGSGAVSLIGLVIYFIDASRATNDLGLGSLAGQTSSG